ncbi:MAG: hypothetical protein CL917_19175 [Deltaproteobacteria bacterium]|nr:hypothetical protein [Deltaproteobacteria bacterium]
MASPARSRPVRFSQRLIAHQKSRTLVATAGIGFSLLVIFVQLGFYGAVVHTALAVSERLNADLMLISPGFVYLGETGEIPQARLFQAMNQVEVESATPLYFRYADWRNPVDGTRCRLFALGFPLENASKTLPIEIPGIADNLDVLRPASALLLDRRTRPNCVPEGPSPQVEVRGRSMNVAGDFDLGVGFLANGAFLVSDETYSLLYGKHPLDRPHLGLLRLKPGSDPDAVAESLRESLPPDVRVITADELNALQKEHWVSSTAAGNIFGLGSIAGFVVGLVVLFEILSTDIRNQLPFYATLMAMGYTHRRLLLFVLQQAWLFALMGYLPALILSSVLFPVIENLTQLPIYLTPSLAVRVLALGFFMCTGAALLSSMRLKRADPAELF